MKINAEHVLISHAAMIAEANKNTYIEFTNQYEGLPIDIHITDATLPQALDECVNKYMFDGFEKRFTNTTIGSSVEKVEANPDNPLVLVTGVLPNLYPSGLLSTMQPTYERLLEEGYTDIRLLALVGDSKHPPAVSWFRQISADYLRFLEQDMRSYKASVVPLPLEKRSPVIYAHESDDIWFY